VNLAVLVEAKRSLGYAISVCLPARNEPATVGDIVRKVRAQLVKVALEQYRDQL
jgi:hypothetical protein